MCKMCKVFGLDSANYHRWKRDKIKRIEKHKKERVYRKIYDTIKEVKQDMFKYIELFYNRKRLHSVLEYMSPVEII